MNYVKPTLLNVVALVALIASQGRLEASPSAGSWCRVGSVDAETTDVYTVWLTAGERTTISIHGDGDTDLDLYLFDENGVEIDSDTSYRDDGVVTVVPRWTGTFRIKVVNYGSVYNRYEICAI